MAIKDDRKFSDPAYSPATTLKALQNGSEEAFVPAFTEDENYKVSVNDFNTQVLSAGTNVNITDHVISAKDTTLHAGAGTNLKIEDNKIYYDGPAGTSSELSAGNADITITQDGTTAKKINASFIFGNEDQDIEEHGGLVQPWKCTSTYFTKSNTDYKLTPHFAGFSMRTLFISAFELVKPDTNEVVHNYEMEMILQENKIILRKIGENFGWIWCIDDATGIPDFTYTDNVDQVPSGYTAVIPVDYTHIIFNIPDVKALCLHTSLLLKTAYRETILIQANKKSILQDSVDPNIPPHIMTNVYVWNGNGIGNYHFYHNGVDFYKSNVPANSQLNVAIVDQVYNGGGGYYRYGQTDLIYPNKPSTGYIPYNIKSIPFAGNHGTGSTDWEINTVHRFFTIAEPRTGGGYNYYIIETMY